VAELAQLPSYLQRIARHLATERGMSEQHAVATSIQTARKFAETGETNLGDRAGQVNLGSREEAAAALADYERERATEPEPQVEPVSDAPFEATVGDFTDEQWAASCVLDPGPGEGTAKQRMRLPIRTPDGRLNRAAVHHAASAIAHVDAPAGVVLTAARRLVSAYAQLGEQPPAGLLELAQMSGAAAGAAAAGAAAAKQARRKQNQTERRDVSAIEHELVEERSAPDTVELEGRTLRGVIPYGVESRDLNGFTEVMAPGCLRNADMADLVATVDHAGLPLGRYPGTLTLEDRDDGLHWSVVLPESRSDVREAVERGDMRSCSWRFVCARDSWDGNRRTVEEVRSLRDVSLVTHAAYPAARAELRAAPETTPEEGKMEAQEQVENEEEARSEPTNGALRVEERKERAGGEVAGTLHARFKRAGWAPGVRAEIAWQEFLAADEQRSVVWTGSVDNIAPIRREAAPLGFDRRWAWPVFGSVAVDPGTTSVAVLTQTARALAAAADVVRAIDATTEKPEVGSTVTVVNVSLKQVAAIASGIPNVYLQQDAIRTIIGGDLRLSINGGLDKLALDALAGAPFHDPGTDPLLVNVREAITILEALGYSPDTLILRPSDSEALDLLRTSGPEEEWVFGPGRFSPGSLFGLNVRVSKDAPEPVVADASAFGRMYASPISLANFEENNGSTNSTLIRMEGHAAFGVERVDAAIRIAAV
jgi:HK97 family phage prohead protease